ncbi:TPA: O-antigen ligase family protein [Streptococcus suis]
MNEQKRGVFFLIAVWFLVTFMLYTERGSNRFIILLAIVALSKQIATRNRVVIPSSFLPLICFVAYYIFISILNGTGIFIVTIKLLLLPFFIQSFIPIGVEKMEVLIDTLKKVMGLAGIFGIIEYFQHYNPLVNVVKINPVLWLEAMNNTLSDYRPSSLFLHYTYFAYVMLIAFCISLVFPYKNRFKNLLYNSILLISIFLSQSRIIWIGLVLILLLKKLTVKTRISKNKFVLRMISIIFIPLVFAGVLDNVFGIIEARFYSIFKFGLVDGSLGQRVGTLVNWFAYLGENIFKGIVGGGYGSTSEYLRNYSYFSGYNTVDSTITTFLVETGIIGSGLFYVGLSSLFYTFLSNRNKMTKLGLYILIVTFVASTTIDFLANDVILYLFYLVLLAVLANIQNYEQHSW